MKSFIDPPQKIPFYLKIGIWITKRITGKDLLPPKLLAWYPKAAIGSGVLESLVAHGHNPSEKRLLKLVRIQASFAVSCSFCIDMNSFEFSKAGITEEEMAALQGKADPIDVRTFSQREKLALEYARFISKSPLFFPPSLIEEMKKNFSEREIVILASTAAQVNYWARLLQALGVPPAGFSDQCPYNGN
ncbi:carboxymuconolactone decarboxylase family protein [Desulfitobacterium sp. AusDCA]|uniref:carboxymuconolactone decarboxylase family protein n=1 Tax=Desulfitobacterium sp. AusDCA TaxID=3240383 RepID=UPI003DA78C2D